MKVMWSMSLIDGVKVFDVKRNSDERGYFAELIREDSRSLLRGDRIMQFSLSCSLPGVIRAWHRHERGQNDYVVCIAGSIKECVYDDRKSSRTKGELDEIVLLGGKRLQLVRVVGACWHGYRVLGNKPALVLYGATRMYNYLRPDEIRRPWDDGTVVPRLINGKATDSRVGKPYDWNPTGNRVVEAATKLDGEKRHE